VSDLRIPNLLDDIARLRLDVDDLLRRAPAFDTPEPPLGCCTAYCCMDTLLEEFEVGEILDLCETEPDPIGGNGLRIEVSGWLSMHLVDSGQAILRIWIDVDGVEYVGSPKWLMTLSSGDEWTMPFGNTIDVPNPDPVITVRIQNLNTPTLRVDQVYTRVAITERVGSQGCGEPAGQ